MKKSIENIPALCAPAQDDFAIARIYIRPVLESMASDETVNLWISGLLGLAVTIWAIFQGDYRMLYILIPTTLFMLIFTFVSSRNRRMAKRWLADLDDHTFLTTPVTAYNFNQRIPPAYHENYQYEARVQLSDHSLLTKTYPMDYQYGLTAVNKAGTGKVKRSMLLFSSMDGKFRMLIPKNSQKKDENFG